MILFFLGAFAAVLLALLAWRLLLGAVLVLYVVGCALSVLLAPPTPQVDPFTGLEQVPAANLPQKSDPLPRAAPAPYLQTGR